MRGFRLLLAAFALVCVFGGLARAQTTTTVTTTTTTTTLAGTWSVISNSDCTALGAATGLTTAWVDCCLGAGQGTCEYRDTYGGTEFQRRAMLTAPSGGYSTGGNSVPSAQIAKLGMNTLLSARCNPTAVLASPPTSAWVPMLRRTDTATAMKMQLFGAAGGTTGLTEAAAATSIANTVADCILIFK